MERKSRSHIIGIRVDNDLYNRLNIRALRHLVTISQYCYQLIYNDVYRKQSQKPPDSDRNASDRG